MNKKNNFPRLKKKYLEEIVPSLMKQYSYKNVNQVPKLLKVVLNMGLGEAVQNVKIIDSAVADLTNIAGQKPVVTKAKKAISAFKIREGLPIGAMVTLRGARMYEFIDRLFNIALPRVRDFKGVSNKGFDGCGNYTFGIKEQIIFPEVNYDRVDKLLGMNITFVCNTEKDDVCFALLKNLGMPFRT